MKLLLDEMYPPKIGEELRRRGHDVAAVAERPAMRGIDDEPLLIAAATEQRVLVTENVADFPDIVAALRTEGRDVCVILVTLRTFPRTARGSGLLIRALDAYLEAHTADRTVAGGTHWLSPPAV